MNPMDETKKNQENTQDKRMDSTRRSEEEEKKEESSVLQSSQEEVQQKAENRKDKVEQERSKERVSSKEDEKPRLVQEMEKKSETKSSSQKTRRRFSVFKGMASSRRLRWLLPLCILLLLGSMLTPLYRPRKIVVLGNNTLKEEEIISMGKIPMNQSIYLISGSQIQKNFSENPYVKSTLISKRFPNTLIVDMNMREEVATVNFMEGFVVIDYTGHILRIEQDVKKIVKPLITGLKEADMLKVGDKLEQAEKSNFQMILDLISNVQNAGLIHNISEMNLQDEKNIHLITTQGMRVLLGDGTDLSYKLSQLSAILVDLHTKKITYGIIDMRYDTYPVYREN